MEKKEDRFAAMEKRNGHVQFKIEPEPVDSDREEELVESDDEEAMKEYNISQEEAAQRIEEFNAKLADGYKPSDSVTPVVKALVSKDVIPHLDISDIIEQERVVFVADRTPRSGRKEATTPVNQPLDELDNKPSSVAGFTQFHKPPVRTLSHRLRKYCLVFLCLALIVFIILAAIYIARNNE